MVAFRNLLGGIMYVDESRVDEYLSNGYKPIAGDADDTKSEEATAEQKDEETKRTVRRKRK